MKLLKVQVKNFRNILDSTEVEIQDDVTCLVGKNESGKTAFLEALRRLNPAQGNPAFNVGRHYPAWLEKRHRMQSQNLEKFKPVSTVFQLEDEDITAIVERFGGNVLESNEITVSKDYSGTKFFGYNASEQHAVANLIASVEVSASTQKSLKSLKTFADLKNVIEELKKQVTEEDKSPVEDAKNIESRIKEVLKDKTDFSAAFIQTLSERLPQFFYFAEYSSLPGIVKIRELLSAKENDLNDDELTARSLLNLAGAENDYLLNPDYETRKRELENVANAITDEVLNYWSTNQELRVNIDITQKTEARNNGHHAVLDELHIRMWDDRHLLSLPFEERSTGFQWFFSFLAAFSRYEYTQEPIIILLDEPGLGLHAKAQKDILRYIDERLAKRCQVIYTTHSPFLIQPGKLERARVVQDKGRECGSKVSSDILSSDPDTLFPLQGALGYDLAQHLFIGQNNLVMEGTSDFTYLTVMSDYLKEQGRTGLDERWSPVPVGGADMIPTFVALLGMHLDVTVLVDSQKAGHQRLQSLAEQGYLSSTRIITVGETLKRKLADIEDLFTIDDYLMLYNKAFGASLASEDLTGNDPIVSRISRHNGGTRFDHGRPADSLMRSRSEILPKLSIETLDNFERLIQRINSTFPTIEKHVVEKTLEKASK